MNRTTLWLASLLQHHKKNIILFGSAAVLLSLVVPSAFAQTEPTVWAHKVSWTTISNLNHTQRRDFPLGMGQDPWPGMPQRTGDQPTVDNTNACGLAQSAGIDAFALDIFPSGGLNWNKTILTGELNAAANLQATTGKAFYVSPCLDSPTQYTPIQLASLIQGLVTSLGPRPAWPKFNGVPIVWTYNSGSSSSYWQQVFSLLNAQNVKVDIILDASSLFSAANTSLPTADLNTYASLPVALYSFGGDTSAGVSRCRQYLSSNYPNSLAAQLTIGTTRPGYWNEVVGGYGDPRGTKSLRDSFASANSSRWVTITTWDDYGENTQVEPSLNMGTGRLDVLHALISARRGQSWPSSSQFYLWQPSEIHGSEAISGEALAMIPNGGTPATVQVNLCDSAGNILVAGTPTTFTTAGIQVAPYSFTLPQMPASRCAYLSLVCQSADSPQKSYLSEPVKVWPTDNPWRTLTGLMWQAGTQSAQPQVTITKNGTIPELEAAQFSGFAGQFFPLLNSNLVMFPDFGSSKFTTDLGVAKSLGPDPWDLFDVVPVSKRWGFFDAKGINPDGTLRWSTPVWVEPTGGYSPVTSWWHFDEGTGFTAADATSYGNMATLQGGAGWSKPGQTGAASLWLDGVTGSVSIPTGIFPTGNFTFQAEIKPLLDAGQTSYTQDQYLFSDVSASLVLRIRADGRIQAQRTDGNGWETATGTTVVPANQWSLITVTYDQQMLRVYYKDHLEATVACTGTRISTATALGCNPAVTGSNYFKGCIDEVQIQAQAVPPVGGGLTVVTPDQQVNVWHCNEGTGATASNTAYYGVPLTLQGTTGWSKPGQTGAACLSLDGTSSRVSIPNGSFPHGTFTFRTEIEPLLAAGQTNYSHYQNIFCDTGGALSLFVRSDGRLQAQRTGGTGWQTAIGTTVVPANQWTQVTVTYDQQSLRLYYNNHLEAIAACTGTHVNVATVLGCNPSGSGSDYFQGCLDEIQFQPQVVAPVGSGTTVTTPDKQVNIWHFDEGTGTIANNATPYGLPLTVQGTTGWSKPGQAGAACLSLDGTSSRVSIPNGDFPHGSFTFQAEIEPLLAAGVTSYPLTNQDIFSDVNGALCLYLRQGKLVVQRSDSKGWETGWGKTVVPANQWSQVTATYDQQTLKVYLNGNLEASVACTGTHINAATALGCNPWNGGCDYFQGCLDEVQFQPTVITPSGSNVVPMATSPDQQVNIWHFDEGTGTTANNATLYGVSLTLQGTTGWSKPGQTGAACLSLDGTSSRVSIPNGDFPHGSFTFQAEIEPLLAAGVTSYPLTNQDIYCDTGGGLILYLRQGKLVVQRADSKGWEIGWGKTVVPANQWSQVTATYDQQTLKVYLNGNLEASVACTGTHINAATALGCNPWNGGCDYFQGCLDEVQFQPTVITPSGS